MGRAATEGRQQTAGGPNQLQENPTFSKIIASSGYGPSAWRTAAERLFFFVNEISSSKSRLEVKDILTLGEEAAKDPEHDLYFFAEILQEEEMAQEIVSRWNERYPHGTTP